MVHMGSMFLQRYESFIPYNDTFLAANCKFFLNKRYYEFAIPLEKIQLNVPSATHCKVNDVFQSPVTTKLKPTLQV